jgi:hypothetical protein
MRGRRGCAKPDASPEAFSSEVDTGSREENAKEQKVGAVRLMQSGRIPL